MEAVVAIVAIFAVVIAVAAAVLLSRGEKKPAPTPDSKAAVYEIEGDGTYSFNIVGESYYQEALDEIAGGKKQDESHDLEVLATLGTQNSNPHDSMAVVVTIGGKCVGYLSREHARWLRGQFNSADTVLWVVKAKIVGGWFNETGEGHYGVRLDIPTGNRRTQP